MAEATVSPDIRRLLLFGGVVAVLIVAVLFFFIRGCVPAMQRGNDYITIYSNLDLKDAANVVARLKEMAIPYQIKESGHAVAVEKAKADQARLSLAEKNLPAGGVVGWEIFDESKLGATDFDRRIQLIRALSGELSRTIRQIEAVGNARVQIVLPETRLFAAEAVPVTASVLLRLKPGMELSKEKINGIVHLVASSVENLQPENVTVVDDTGRILTANFKPIKAEPEVSLKESMAEVVLAASGGREELVATAEVVESTGLAAVTAVVPELTAEEKILLKVQAKKELENNLAGKAQEILNRFYPLNSVIVKVDALLKNGGQKQVSGEADIRVGKLSAIVLVDNRVELTADLRNATYSSVAAALGYDKKRGDRILLQRVPFHLAEPPPEVVSVQVEENLPPTEAEPVKPANAILNWRPYFWLAAGLLLVILVLLVLAKLLAQPKRKSVPLAAEPRRSEPPRTPPFLEQIKTMTERNPEQIAELLRKWLSES